MESSVEMREKHPESTLKNNAVYRIIKTCGGMRRNDKDNFLCHGNICRSPMAEFVMKDLVEKAGLSGQFEIASAASWPIISSPWTATTCGIWCGLWAVTRSIRSHC